MLNVLDLIAVQWKVYKTYAVIAAVITALSWHYIDRAVAVNAATASARSEERVACVDAANKARAVTEAKYAVRAAHLRAELAKRRAEDEKVRALEDQNAELLSAIAAFDGRKARAWSKEMAKELGR